MVDLIEKYLYDQPNSYYRGWAQSVHGRGYVRVKVAREQASFSPVAVETISKLVIQYLGNIGISTTDTPVISASKIDYLEIKNQYHLRDVSDILWMKFTKDNYLGVVAVSNDVNFDIPPDASVYNEKITVYNERKKRYEDVWKYNTSGILIHKLGKQWNEEFVLLFPLCNIPDGYKRGDIEKAVGNYLIENNVPILDFYSHLYHG